MLVIQYIIRHWPEKVPSFDFPLQFPAGLFKIMCFFGEPGCKRIWPSGYGSESKSRKLLRYVFLSFVQFPARLLFAVTHVSRLFKLGFWLQSFLKLNSH